MLFSLKGDPFANFINLGNNITIINKPFGRSDIGIPASTRDFFINAIAMAYFIARLYESRSIRHYNQILPYQSQ
jgi:hypothetical protein